MDNENEKKYLRMTFNERIQHFSLVISFITLVLTGFALKFPDAIWVRWFRNLIGEGAFDLRGLIHRIAAVIMVLDSLYHLFYISFTTRGKQLIKDFMFNKKDITDTLQSLKYLFGRTNEKPKYGRFGYVEKSEYWAMVWGTVVMSITGSILWFENTFMPKFTNLGMDIATVIHYYEAILATLAIIVWHFYFVIFNPDVYPMNKAWFTGYLTEEEMGKEHPLELEKMVQLERAELQKENSEIEITDMDTVQEETIR